MLLSVGITCMAKKSDAGVGVGGRGIDSTPNTKKQVQEEKKCGI